MGAGAQYAPQYVVSDVSGVTVEGGVTPNSTWKVGVSSFAEYARGGEQAASLPGTDTMGASSCCMLQLLVNLRRVLSLVYVLPYYLSRQEWMARKLRVGKSF